MDVDATCRIFKKYDKNDDGELNYEEFRMSLIDLMRINNPELLSDTRTRILWNYADLDKTGALNLEEFVVWYQRWFACKTSPETKHDSSGDQPYYVSDSSPFSMFYQNMGSKRYGAAQGY